MNKFLDKDDQIKLLKDEIKELKILNDDLQERLSKYTNPKRIKDWQNKNKESIKEYHKTYYQNQKEKKNEKCV